jgi:hypothetical protein
MRADYLRGTGWIESNLYLAIAQKYDTVTRQCSLLPPMPAGRWGAASASVGDRIYVSGGAVSPYAVSAEVYTFDVMTQFWGWRYLYRCLW